MALIAKRAREGLILFEFRRITRVCGARASRSASGCQPTFELLPNQLPALLRGDVGDDGRHALETRDRDEIDREDLVGRGGMWSIGRIWQVLPN